MPLKKSIQISLFFHLLILAVGLLATLLGGCKDTVRPDHVFEMVDLSAADFLPTPQPEPQPRPAPQRLPQLQVPDIQPPAPEPEPEVTPPAPLPKPKPQTPPPPKPKAEPKPTPAPPKPKPEPPKTINYEKFTQTHELPKNAPKPQPKPRPTVQAPTFDVSKFSESLNKSLEQIELKLPANSSLSKAEKDALQAYGNALRSRSEQAWSKPNLVGRAVVSIEVASDGTLTARLTQSSGNDLFDRSVMEAIRSLRKMPPPPGGKPVNFELPFSIQAG